MRHPRIPGTLLILALVTTPALAGAVPRPAPTAVAPPAATTLIPTAGSTPAGGHALPPAPLRAAAAHDDLARIVAFRETWLDALAAGDARAVTRGFAHGAVLMPHYVAPRLGAAAIRDWYETSFHHNGARFDYASRGIEIVGDMAFERWTVTVTLAPGPANEDLLGTRREVGQFTDTGVRVYRRLADGSWKIDREVWNGNPRAARYLTGRLEADGRLPAI